MIGRGWGMPEPLPDEHGGDYQECAVETQKKKPDAFPD